MPWLWLLLGLAMLALGITAESVAFAAIGLFGAIVLLLSWVVGLIAQRVNGQAQDIVSTIDVHELRQLRKHKRPGPPPSERPDDPTDSI